VDVEHLALRVDQRSRGHARREQGLLRDGPQILYTDAKATYVSAIRDWVLHGAASRHVFDPEGARARVSAPTESVARAHAAFRLGQYLIRKGRAEEGDRWLAEASRLHPESWCMWRQRSEVNELGLASSPAFWERVDALGTRRYYAPVDMEGMPE
jgi:hypothetical protein